MKKIILIGGLLLTTVCCFSQTIDSVSVIIGNPASTVYVKGIKPQMDLSSVTIVSLNDMNNTQSIFDPSLYDISVGSHKNKAVIWLRFPFDASLVIALKSVTKAYWSRTQKSWYILDTNKNRELCNLEKKIIGKAAFEKISPENFIELEKYKNRLILKGFSYNTIKTY